MVRTHAYWEVALYSYQAIMLQGRHSNGLIQTPAPNPYDDLDMLLLCKATLEGETVLDPFLGSGTTLVAAKATGRKGIGMRLRNGTAMVAAKRLEQEAFDFVADRTRRHIDMLEIWERYSCMKTPNHRRHVRYGVAAGIRVHVGIGVQCPGGGRYDDAQIPPGPQSRRGGRPGSLPACRAIGAGGRHHPARRGNPRAPDRGRV